jgi:hypothetical protein
VKRDKPPRGCLVEAAPGQLLLFRTWWGRGRQSTPNTLRRRRAARGSAGGPRLPRLAIDAKREPSNNNKPEKI